MYTNGYSKILSTGVYLPEKRLTSQEILEDIGVSHLFGMPNTWLDRVFGISERRVADEDALPSQMATLAAEEALKRADIQATDIDVLIYAGMDRDHIEPATAHIVQNNLGASNAICFDLSNACHGFMDAVLILNSMINSQPELFGLIVTGERNWRIGRKIVGAVKESKRRADFDRWVGGLSLGDAAAAMVITGNDSIDMGFLGFEFQSDGRFNDLCVVDNEGESFKGHMAMTSIVNVGVSLHANIINPFLEKIGWNADDIDIFIQHQVGKKASKAVFDSSGIEDAYVSNTLPTLGNITSATIPVNLYQLDKTGSLSKGKRVFIFDAGSGISASNSALIWE